MGGPGGGDDVAGVELRAADSRRSSSTRTASTPTTSGIAYYRARWAGRPLGRPAKLARRTDRHGKGIRAGHKRRTRRFPDRHRRGQHPVRPVGQPGLLRVVVPVPRQQPAGLGRARRLRLPVRLAPAQGPLRPGQPARRTSTRTRWCCCPTIRCRTCARELEKLGFHRFFETTDSVKHRVSGPKGDLDVMIIALRAPADGPIGDSGLVVSDGETVAFNMNDARPVDLEVLHDRVRPRRRAHAAVLGRHLVPDGLRHARAGQGGVRHPEASAADGPLQAVHRAGRRDLGGAVRGPAVLPGSRTARPQRRSRRPGEHLPRPGGVPRPDAPQRPRPRAADDPRARRRTSQARN